MHTDVYLYRDPWTGRRSRRPLHSWCIETPKRFLLFSIYLPLMKSEIIVLSIADIFSESHFLEWRRLLKLAFLPSLLSPSWHASTRPTTIIIQMAPPPSKALIKRHNALELISSRTLSGTPFHPLPQYQTRTSLNFLLIFLAIELYSDTYPQMQF